MAATVAKSYFNADIPEIVVKSLFKKYDTDGSGRLGKNEMSSMLKDDLGMSPEQARACILMVDKDGCGQVSFDEFFLWLRTSKGFDDVDKKSRFYVIQEAVKLFKKFDKDDSDTIDREEFKELMASLNACDESQLDSARQSLDTSGDGKISFSEFLNWLNWLPRN